MNRLKIFSSLLIVSAAMFLASCFDDAGTDILLEDTYVEIQEATTSAGTDISKSYERLNDGIPKRDSIRVNLVGRQRSAPLTVNFTVDAASTAVAGVHYDLISNGSTTIPANSSFGYIYFDVYADNIDAFEVWKLTFELSSGEVQVSENYATFTRSMRITCPFDIDAFVGTYTCIEPGYSGSPYTTVFTLDTDANTVVNDNFWDTGDAIKYVFSPTGGVTINAQDIGPYDVGRGPELLTVTGTGTYDACEESFIVDYVVATKSDNIPLDQNTHTFTKN